MRRRFLLGAVLLAAASLAGCRGPYLARLAWEQSRYLGGARPAVELLATDPDPARRRALETLLEVRAFAEREGLDVGGSYLEVADASPFQVVTAAPVDRLEPYTWWYPIVGPIPYRGYFDRAPAESFAAGLRAEGFDTRIVQASAYSTLGWFDDPLPASVLARGEDAVVITVLHELVHQTFFAPGEVAFNETLATAAAWRLAERFYAARGDPAKSAAVVRSRESWIERSRVLDAAALRLRGFFEEARAGGWPRDRLLSERAALYREILAEVRTADPPFAAQLGEGGLDNASFLGVYRYATEGADIDAFLAAHGSVAEALAGLDRIQQRRGDLFEAVRDVGREAMHKAAGAGRPSSDRAT